MRIPNDVTFNDVEVDFHPFDPDDMGGGAPAITVQATIYNVKELDKLVKTLQKRRAWLARMNKVYGE